MDFLKEIETGVYEKKQILSKSRLISWSHKSRFNFGVAQALAHGGNSILDYGCGDGTFLKSLEGHFESMVGADISRQFIEDCRERFSRSSQHNFLLIDDLMEVYADSKFDVITCMETMEHCTDEAIEFILTNCRRMLAPDGLFLISVPIEIGASLVAKQVARSIAGLRNIGDYKNAIESYSLSEMVTMTFAGSDSSIEREPLSDQISAYGHKGFNWKKLRARIIDHFEIDSIHFTPIPITGKFLNSQVWFICKSRA